LPSKLNHEPGDIPGPCPKSFALNERRIVPARSVSTRPGNPGDIPGFCPKSFALNKCRIVPARLIRTRSGDMPRPPRPGDIPGPCSKSFALNERRSVPWRLLNFGISRILFALALALTAHAQTAEEIESPAVTRVVDKLACTCGCKMSMACQMDPYPGCKVCYSHRLKVLEMQKAGMGDQAILDKLAQDEGKAILLTPPGVIGSISFYTAGILGLILVLFVIRKYRQKGVAAVAVASETEDPALSRYHDQIEKETAKLE